MLSAYSLSLKFKILVLENTKSNLKSNINKTIMNQQRPKVNLENTESLQNCIVYTGTRCD